MSETEDRTLTREEHIREAEHGLAVAESCYWEGPRANTEFAQVCLMAAQTHAMLAALAPAGDSGGEA